MRNEIARAWSVLLIRGICNVLFALCTFLRPGLALFALVLIWGAYAVVDGATELAAGIAARRGGGPHRSLLVAGITGLLAGLTAWVWPAITLGALLAVIAIWAVLRGLLELAAAVQLRHVLPRAWLLGSAGAASTGFGLLLMLKPVTLVALVYLAGAICLVIGVLTSALAVHLRSVIVSDPAGLLP
jgi:uncharacterized membrane protein HdeD (DUF308 family)